MTASRPSSFQSMLVTPATYQPVLAFPCRLFTGKTEDGHKWKTPKLTMRKVNRIEAPGLNLKIPKDLTPEKFCLSIGGDCDDIADKFETIDQIFTYNSEKMKYELGIPCRQRKYILRCVEQLRAGFLTFEYLDRRTVTERCRD